MEPHATILVVDDEPDLREGLRHNLEAEGFAVTTANDGRDCLDRVRSEAPDLVVLDLMMPGVDGLTALRSLRGDGVRVPIIVLTAKSRDRDVVDGLESGADDYVTKPFGLDELTARIRAVLRRAAPTDGKGPDPGPLCYEFDDLSVDFRRFTVRCRDVEHQLSRYEAEILRLLIRRRGRVVSREDLLSEVWGYRHLPTTRTVDNHIARLRKKVEPRPEEPVHVLTAHGFGYLFEGEPLHTE